MNWVALFSQTGSEIKRIADELGTWPSHIITTNFNTDQWEHNVPADLVTCMSPSAINTGMKYINEKNLVTLHGYLRILPSDVCDKHEIYNGHPGAIHLYPELKGKDPQEKVWSDITKYPVIGSVVHKVIPEVDSGEILYSEVIDNTCISKEELYNKLKETSLKAWLSFMKDML